jgi:hypothetical protein
LTSAAQLASSDPLAGSEFGTLANVRLSNCEDFVMLVLIETVDVVDEVVDEDVVVVDDDGAVTVDA